MTRSIRAAERRERIIRSAIGVFAEGGYTAATTAQVAAEAGVSKETIYSYFGNKAGLLREALTSLVAAPSGLVPAEPDGVASADELRARLESMAMSLTNDLTQPHYLALSRIVVAETPRDPSLAEMFRDVIAGRVLSAVARSLTTWQRAGLVDADVDTAAAARAFVGPLLTYVLLDGLLRPSTDIRRPPAEAVRAQVALLCRAIARDN